MQKTLANLAEGVLSRDQMKKVLGGAGSCTFRCPGGNRECTSASGNCSGSAAFVAKQWIKCDSTTYSC